MADTERKVARALLEIGAVGFTVDNPITFKSGILSPVYCDNRTFPFHPDAWKTIIHAFSELVITFKPEVIAGVEAAGIPHSAALGFNTHTPSVFVRKEAKDHGTKKMVEGGDVAGKRVLLVEDLVTTGGSSLKAVASLRAEGAMVDHVAVIVNYGFPEAKDAFSAAKVTVHALTSFPIILEEARFMEKVTDAEIKEILAWSAHPRGWRA